MGNFSQNLIDTRDDGIASRGRIYIVPQGTFLGPGLTYRTRIITPSAPTAVWFRPEFSSTQSGDTLAWDFYEDPTFTNTTSLAIPIAVDRRNTIPAKTAFQNNPNASAFGLLLDAFGALNQGQVPNRDFPFWRLLPDEEYLSLITNISAATIVPLPRLRIVEAELNE